MPTSDRLGSYRLVDATLVEPNTRSAAVATISVEGERITRLPLRPIPFEASIKGMYVLPGLIDMHIHLVPSLVGGRSLVDGVFERCDDILRRFAVAGITTVRDLGGPLAELLTLRRTRHRGSRLLIAGPVLTVPGGHGAHSGHGIVVDTPDTATSVIEALAEAGVDHIKIVTSGAHGKIQMPAELFSRAVTVSKRLGLPVAVHAHFQLDQIERAVREGVATVEHGFHLSRRPDLLQAMASTNVAFCPTLRVIESIREDLDWYGQKLIPQAWEDARSSTRAATVAGVSLVAGTDFGVFGVGEGDVWREISLISECAGTRWIGLAAATSEAAKVLQRPDLGSLDDGATADLVVLRRNPVLEHVDASDVAAVIIGGVLVYGDLALRAVDAHG